MTHKNIHRRYLFQNHDLRLGWFWISYNLPNFRYVNVLTKLVSFYSEHRNIISSRILCTCAVHKIDKQEVISQTRHRGFVIDFSREFYKFINNSKLMLNPFWLQTNITLENRHQPEAICDYFCFHHFLYLNIYTQLIYICDRCS